MTDGRTRLPARGDARPAAAVAASAPNDELRLDLLWQAVRRNFLLLTGCIGVAVASAVAYTVSAPRIYESSMLLGLQKAGRSPEADRQMVQAGSEVAGEMQVLGSRTLVTTVIRQLGLQPAIREPNGVPRSELFAHVRAEGDADSGSFTLLQSLPSRFSVQRDDGTADSSTYAAGDSIRIGKLELVLAPGALAHERIVVDVRPLRAVVDELREELRVNRPSNDASLIRVRHRSTDRELAAAVLNALASEYLARRQENYTSGARARVAFLREQTKTLAQQLASAENALRSYRESEHVLDPKLEGSGQITRLAALRAARGDLETQRAALAALLRSIQESPDAQAPGMPTVMRRVTTFPALMQNAAVSELVKSITTVEQQRADLLLRRTERDREVRTLSDRLNTLDGQLQVMVSTYQLSLAKQIGALDDAITASGREVSSLPRKEVEFARLERHPKVLEAIYASLQTQLKEVEIAAAAGDYTVHIVDTAIPGREPVSPRPLLNIFAAVVLGGLVGMVGAGVREHADDRLHTRAAVQTLTSVPVLSIIPHLSPTAQSRLSGIRARLGGRRPPQPVLFGGAAAPSDQEQPVGDAESVQWEAFNRLQTNLLHAWHEPDVNKILVFTSPLPAEGKTTVVVNLALGLARHGFHVLLIDADLRRGSVHRALGLGSEPGLRSVLRGEAHVNSAIVRVHAGRSGRLLDVLPSGTGMELPTALLNSDAMCRLLSTVESEYDLVLIDSPPVNLTADATMLAAAVSGVVLIVRAGATERGAVEYAMEQLRLVSAPLIGAVLNDVDFARDARYDGSYRYFARSELYQEPAASVDARS